MPQPLSVISRSDRSQRGFGLPAATLVVLIAASVLLTAFFPWSEQRQAGQLTRTLNTSGAVTVTVETGSGDIAVHRGGSSSVVIHAIIFSRHPEDDAALIRQVEQNPPIHQTGERIQVGPLPHEWARRLSLAYEITAPAATSANLSTGSGNVRVEGLQGVVHLDTGSGGIDANNIGQSLHASTGSGDITARTVQGPSHLQTGSGSIHAWSLTGPATLSTGSGDITITGSRQATRGETGSGSIHATDVHGDFRARTGSGDISAQGELSGGHRWELFTGSGNIDLSLPSGTHANADLQTDSGSIHSDIPVQVQGKLSAQHMTGTLGAANSNTWLSVRTGSGDIRIH